MYPILDIDFITTESIIKGVLVDCQDTVKYQIPWYFLNTKYWDEKCHAAQHYVLVTFLVLFDCWLYISIDLA